MESTEATHETLEQAQIQWGAPLEVAQFHPTNVVGEFASDTALAHAIENGNWSELLQEIQDIIGYKSTYELKASQQSSGLIVSKRWRFANARGIKVGNWFKQWWNKKKKREVFYLTDVKPAWCDQVNKWWPIFSSFGTSINNNHKCKAAEFTPQGVQVASHYFTTNQIEYCFDERLCRFTLFLSPPCGDNRIFTSPHVDGDHGTVIGLHFCLIGPEGAYNLFQSWPDASGALVQNANVRDILRLSTSGGSASNCDDQDWCSQNNMMNDYHQSNTAVWESNCAQLLADAGLPAGNTDHVYPGQVAIIYPSTIHAVRKVKPVMNTNTNAQAQTQSQANNAPCPTVGAAYNDVLLGNSLLSSRDCCMRIDTYVRASAKAYRDNNNNNDNEKKHWRSLLEFN